MKLNGFRKPLFTAGREALKIANRLFCGVDKYAGSKSGVDIAPVFVIGLPRSGTTLVYELVVQAFELNYLSHMFDYTYGLPNVTTRLTSRMTRNPLPRYESSYGRIPGFFSPAENSNFWMRWFPERPSLGHYVPPELLGKDEVLSANEVVGSITQIARRPYVFKNVYFTLSIASLLKIFPEAKLILVRRDRESVANSIYKRRIELQSWRSWWSIRPPFSEDYVSREMLEQVAFQCVRGEQLMEKALEDIGKQRYFSIDYKDLCASPRDFLHQLSDWLGGSYRLRAKQNVPARFESREAVRFAPDLARNFDSFVAAMTEDRDSYMAALDRQVRSMQARK